MVGVSTFLENAGASRIRGLETELTWQATDALRLEATASFLDAKFNQLRLADTTSSVLGAQIDLAGNQLISAPRFSTTLNADYERPIVNGMLRINVSRPTPTVLRVDWLGIGTSCPRLSASRGPT